MYCPDTQRLARFGPDATEIRTRLFLILELNSLFSDLLRISDVPVQYALSRLGQ